MSIQLRDYQRQCIDTILEQPPGRYLVQMATGLGKTVTFANIPRNGKRMLILSHREELVEQPRKYFDCPFGIERASNRSHGEEVVSASVQTLVRRLDKFAPDEFGLIVCDECFPAGTMVDGRPIETIKIGDFVTAYNHKTGLQEKRRVTYAFKLPAPNKMVRINGNLTCTPNHPIYETKKRRYINAREIAPGDCLLFRMQQADIVGGLDEDEAGQLQKIGKGLLLRGTQNGIPQKNVFGNNGANKSQVCVRENESQQSDEQTRNPRTSIGHTSQNRSQAESARREWDGVDKTAGAFNGEAIRDGACQRVHCENGSKENRQLGTLPNPLQDRYCDTVSYAGDRGGWEQPLCAGETGAGREEGEVFEVCRVESVEILEFRSDEESRSVCRDGYVYNLEVDGLNNYFANDFLVHNCHHAASRTYRKILNYFQPEKLIGVTATVMRGDKIRLDDIFQKIIFQRDLRWGIQNGYLTDILCKRVNIGYDLSAVHSRMGDYAPGELEEAMDGTADAIAQAYREHAKGPTLIFAVSVNHANEIAAKIPGAAVVTGKTQNRGEIIQAFTDGKIPVIVNCMVFTEGTDIPRVETVIIARPTQSESLYCLDEETEILTETGWKKDIEIGEKVAAFDIDTGEIRFAPALAKVRRKLEPDEYFCSISGPCCDIRVTNKHRMVYRNQQDKAWRIGEAEKVASRTSGAYIPVSGHGAFSELPLTDDEIRFIGWVMTDGHINPLNNQISITQSSTQPWIGEIQRVIDSCGFKCGRRIENSKTQFNRNGDNVQWTISKGKPRGRDSHLKGWAELEPYLSKNFAPSLHQMSERQFDILLETCHLADGHKQVSKNWTQRSYHITKGNKTFIENLQIAAILRGWRANLSTRINNNGNPIYTLHLKKQDFINIGSTIDSRPRWTKEAHTDESCWCVQNWYGTLITRRNGKITITGNCQMAGRGLRLYPGKERLILIDCVGVTGRASLCTAPSLLGLDMDSVPVKARDSIEGELFELPDKIIAASDCPESWIRNVEIVDLWAKEQNYNMHDVNFFKMPDGSLKVSIPTSPIVIPAPDALGNVRCKDGSLLTMQDCIDRVYKKLTGDYQHLAYIWDMNQVKRWGKAPASKAQLKIIQRRCKGFDCEGLTKGQASMILNRIMNEPKKKKAPPRPEIKP